MQTQRVCREVFHVSPGQGRDIQAVVGTIQGERFFFAGWRSHHYVKAAAESDNQLLLLPVRMPATLCTSRHIVGPKYPFDVKGYVVLILEKGKVAAGVLDSRQI